MADGLRRFETEVNVPTLSRMGEKVGHLGSLVHEILSGSSHPH
jgi:hypothetical protein